MPHSAHAGKPRSVSMRQPPASSGRRGSDYTGYIPPSLKRHGGNDSVVENGTTDDTAALVQKGLAQNPNRAEMPAHSKRKGSYDYTAVSYSATVSVYIICYTCVLHCIPVLCRLQPTDVRLFVWIVFTPTNTSKHPQMGLQSKTLV